MLTCISQVYVHLQTPQGATALKHQLEVVLKDQTHLKKPSGVYTPAHINPFKTLPKDVPARDKRPDNRSSFGNQGGQGSYNSGNRFNRGGYHRGNMNVGYNNRNFSGPAGGMGMGGGFVPNNMGGFGGNMAGMNQYGNYGRGNMMGGGMRGNMPNRGRGGMMGGGMAGIGGNMAMGMGNMGMPGNMAMPGMAGMGGNMGMMGAMSKKASLALLRANQSIQVPTTSAVDRLPRPPSTRASTAPVLVRRAMGTGTLTERSVRVQSENAAIDTTSLAFH